jgi:hypothetical protein
MRKQARGEFSRREFIKDAGLIAGGAAIGSVSTLVTTPAEAADPVSLTVYDPTGSIQVTQLNAPRLDTLAGKTICQLGDGMWQDSRTFPLIAELLQKQFPTAKIIPYTEFATCITGGNTVCADVAERVKAKG